MQKILLACLPAVLFCLAGGAQAEDVPIPDKSAYTLFNPVPDNLMRSFSTDRPTKSDSPYTVDAGHFQYEADIANWIYDRYNAAQVTTSNLLLFDPTLKFGLTRNTDLEFALAPININHATARPSGAESSAFGFGDVYTRVKFNLFGDDGGDYALAVVPYVKAPTAPRSIGNGRWEGGAYAPLVIALPDDWAMDITTEYDRLENAALNGTHGNYANLINFGHPVLAENVTGYVEFWSDVNTDAGAQTQYTLDFALAWLALDNVQLDAGINLGLNKAAPDAQVYAGISQRF